MKTEFLDVFKTSSKELLTPAMAKIYDKALESNLGYDFEKKRIEDETRTACSQRVDVSIFDNHEPSCMYRSC